MNSSLFNNAMEEVFFCFLLLLNAPAGCLWFSWSHSCPVPHPPSQDSALLASYWFRRKFYPLQYLTSKPVARRDYIKQGAVYLVLIGWSGSLCWLQVLRPSEGGSCVLCVCCETQSAYVFSSGIMNGFSWNLAWSPCHLKLRQRGTYLLLMYADIWTYISW